jgi:hypothetical protein
MKWLASVEVRSFEKVTESQGDVNGSTTRYRFNDG